MTDTRRTLTPDEAKAVFREFAADPPSSESELRGLLDRLCKAIFAAEIDRDFVINAGLILADYRALKQRKGWT